MDKKEQFKICMKIANRAEKENLFMFDDDKLSLILDLECAINKFDLKLNDLLNTDNINFAHDIYGIQNNLNRQTKEFENYFVPRFANKDRR